MHDYNCFYDLGELQLHCEIQVFFICLTIILCQAKEHDFLGSAHTKNSELPSF